MNTMRRQALGYALAAVLAGFAAGPAEAARPQAVPSEALTREQAAEHDLPAIAAALGVDQERARSIMNVQERAADLAEQLRERHAGRLAGVFIEHDPKDRLVVRLTGQQAVRTQFHHFGADTIEVAFETGAAHTVKQLTSGLDRVLKAGLGDRASGIHAGYVDERTGAIVIEVNPGTKAIAVLQEKMGRLANVPIRIEEAPRAVTHAVYGSGLLSSLCTTGFAVNHAASNTHGVLTAGHCDTGLSQVYTGIDLAVHTLNEVALLANANADLLRLGNTAVLYGGYFYADAWRAATGRRTRAATTTGAVHCHYGRNGGYNCGNVQSTVSNPGSICGPNNNVACNAVYVRVGGPTLFCIGGDSGGPWFTASTIAAGIHFSGPMLGGSPCHYTSTDWAYDSMGLNLLYP
jgi:streptogrisin C